MRDLPWVAVDLEMTGLDPERDRICEIGLVWGRDGAVEGAWETLVDPGVAMPREAQAVHGLRSADLKGAPRLDEVLGGVLERLDHAVVVAHHAPVDLAFLAHGASRCGRSLPPVRVQDTLVLARRVLALKRHRLLDVAQLMGVPTPPAHRALDDARATFDAFARFVELLDPERALTVDGMEGQVESLRRASPVRSDQRARLEGSATARRPVHLTYVSRDDDGRPVRTERVVSVWRVRGTKLEAFCHLRGEARVFRLDRVLAVADAVGAYTAPSGPARLA